jgi:hypothetical protein
MHRINSVSALERFATTCPDESLRPLLTAKVDLLADYDDLATFVIVARTDTLDHLEPWPAPEVVEAFAGWTVVTIILSDEGEGVILFVPDDADRSLLASIMEGGR